MTRPNPNLVVMSRFAARLLSHARYCGILLLPVAARAQGAPDRALGPARVGAQVALGTAATPIGFVGSGLVFRSVARAFHAQEDDASRVADVGAGFGVALAAAGSAALIGARGPGSGSFPAAVGGGAVGVGLSGLLILVNRKKDIDPGKPCHIGCILASAAIATLPSIGATVAYDVSRR